MNNKQTHSGVTLLGGNNFDKKQLMNVQRRINRDPDIKRLIRKGKYGAKLAFLLAVFVIFVYFDSTAIFKKATFLWSTDISHTTSAILATMPFFVWEVANIKNTIKSKTQELFTLFSYMRYTWLGEAPKTPADLWHSINANVSDAQAILPASRKLGKDVSFVYTGEPYFTTRPIDTITIQWNGSWKIFLQNYLIYKKFFRDFSIETLSGHSEKATFLLEERKLKISSAVFGVLFNSQFFKKITAKHQAVIQMNIKEKMSEEDKKFGKEFIKLCTSSSTLYWNEVHPSVSKEKIQLTLSDISYLDDKHSLNRFRRIILELHNFFGKKIRLPVKKFIAIPKKNFSDDSKEKLIVSLGGAEQNLGLAYFVNQNRWNHSDSRIGIAENEFDESHNTKFQIGMESLVYGVNREMIGREISARDRTRAEVFSFYADHLLVVSIYGYSAPMTKIAILHFFNTLSRQTEYALPWKSMEVKNILTYRLNIGENQNIFGSEALKDWDKNDPMNQSDDAFFNNHTLTIY